MLKQAWEVWTKVDRPDITEYRATIRGIPCELWWDAQMGVEPGWCVRINPGSSEERDIPVKGRKDSKMSTLHRNVLEALR